MKYMVTGGAGFIGSHLVNALVDQGHTVICVDNQSSDGHELFKWNDGAVNINSDINDLTYSDFQGVDTVFHMAAEVSIPRCIAQPRKTFASNVDGTFNVLDCAKRAGVNRFIFSSTSAIYGNGCSGMYGDGQNETAPVNCLNIYATSKLMCEQLCKLYAEPRFMDTVCLRYFNVYGEGQSNKGQYCPVVAVFKRQKEEGKPLTVVGDGMQTRDYIHVSDIVSANIQAAIANRFFNGDVINIGTGRSHSVMEIARIIAGEEGTIKFLPPRQGEARHTLCNNSKALELLAWKPKISLHSWLSETLQSK
jgi:UDP-glucose 4-epimerase